MFNWGVDPAIGAPLNAFAVLFNRGKRYSYDGSLPLDTSYPLEGYIPRGSGLERTFNIDYGSTDYVVAIQRAWSSMNPDLGLRGGFLDPTGEFGNPVDSSRYVTTMAAHDYTTYPDFIIVEDDFYDSQYPGEEYCWMKMIFAIKPNEGHSFTEDFVFWTKFTETIEEGGGIVGLTAMKTYFKVDVSDPPASVPVPEPTTMLLLGTGLVGLAAFRRRKRILRN